MKDHIMTRGLLVGLQTTWILGKIIFPVTLLVSILSFTPVLDGVIWLCTPLMSWVGLSGEAVIPFVLANLLNLYAGIGAILSLELTVKEVFILAVMTSFSHNLLVETAVAVKVGVKAWVVVAVRLGLAFFSALLIHWFWSGGGELAQYGLVPVADQQELTEWSAILFYSLQTALIGIAQLAAIVIPVMMLIQWLKEKQALVLLSRWMRPLTRLLGLSPNTSLTLGAGLCIGLAFGAGVIIQQAKEENIAKKDLYLLFIFLVACHAVVEDTLLFIPLGIPVWPLLLIRLLVALFLTVLISMIWKRWTASKQAASS